MSYSATGPVPDPSTAVLERPHVKTVQDSPSQRTGPPRSLSLAYSLSATTSKSRNDTIYDDGEALPSPLDDRYNFTSQTSDFRSALEHRATHDAMDRKGKKRESRDDVWNPRRWFQDTQKVEPSKADSTGSHEADGTGYHDPDSETGVKPSMSTSTDDPNSASKQNIRRALSFGPPTPDKSGRVMWNRLRSLIPSIIAPESSSSPPGRFAVVSNEINITDELITGGLAVLILRLWFERDEKGHRRGPVLFHRLRIRVSDSLHPMHGSKTVFRIECQYAHDAVRWVVYKQLRDFVSLHTHYTMANLQNRNISKLPEFPRASLPYFKYLKKEGRDISPADFAHLQRESLENYLLDLIRAVMFHPSANRLAAFLEIGALTISLAPSGGAQYKAGVVHIESACDNNGGFGRKSVGWRTRKEPKWTAVRESYLVVLEEPGELTIWDVFLLDSDFKIERPKRYYRQLLHPDALTHDHLHPSLTRKTEKQKIESDCVSVLGSLKSRVSRIFHPNGSRHPAPAIEVDHEASDDNDSLSSSSSSAPSPMLDPSTHRNPQSNGNRGEQGNTGSENDNQRKPVAADVSKHTFYISNSQIRLKVFAFSERQMLQWIAALEKVEASCQFTKRNRFDSFAPIRLNVATQWLVDGRDYFWNLSRAILLARESIYIHDWWLSPELELRRPNKGRYRLDRLLGRKAKEGVMIYIILYQEVSNLTTPTDSSYAKQRLLSLHPNIMVQRSPSHFQTLYWAHHEKLCVIDQTIAFIGGLDLCFGRWDTPQHVLVDDPEGTEQSEIWPGKDYSNPRFSDFYELHKPAEDMYDRSKVPRMPWHDVAMQVVGQPARDLARHFIERWNHLLRIKNHSRVMPFLLPPPDFRLGELDQLGLTGTCEMQICRSIGPWSMGTAGKTERSIENAYLKAIQVSEHFVYIENQFFITSTTVNDVKIENKIGDAIVHRIIKAHREGTKWKCCVLMPLLPGFTFPVDHSDASAIRIILECQNYSISRGPHSIFGRLLKEGINPDNYIKFFSLRSWAKLRSDILTTEQVYIHSKLCIVDDRLVIIGSANINERSMRGDRDSELAVVIRDTDMLDCTMADRPFKVGRFAHSLRVRLMREHLGIDVDGLDLEESQQVPEGPSRRHDSQYTQPAQETEATSLISSLGSPGHNFEAREKNTDIPGRPSTAVNKINDTFPGDDGIQGRAGTSKSDEEYSRSLGFGGSRLSPELRRSVSTGALRFPASAHGIRPSHETSEAMGSDQASPPPRSSKRQQVASTTWVLPMQRPKVDADDFEDPVTDTFWQHIWLASADYNTEIFRRVFRCIPDDAVKTWKQYKEFTAHHDRLNKRPIGKEEVVGRLPSETGLSVHEGSIDRLAEGPLSSQENIATETATIESEKDNEMKSRQPSRGTEPFEQWQRDEMEKLLMGLNGHLVIYPTKFLEGEDTADNFLFNADRMMPLLIYD